MFALILKSIYMELKNQEESLEKSKNQMEEKPVKSRRISRHDISYKYTFTIYRTPNEDVQSEFMKLSEKQKSQLVRFLYQKRLS